MIHNVKIIQRWTPKVPFNRFFIFNLTKSEFNQPQLAQNVESEKSKIRQ